MRTGFIAALLVSAAVVNAQQTPPKPDPPIAFTAEAVVWKDAPATLPAGSKMAVLEGDPRADGLFTMRVRIPAGSAIPPHWHPRQERVTILSGAVDLGFGSVANAGNVTRYRAGSFYVNPPRVMHYLFFPEATEMQMTGCGPWELQTTDISTQPGTAATATATATVRNITPAAGSELTPSTTITATVDYDIRGFKPSTYYLDIVFESTTPNHTFCIGPTVAGGRPVAPPRPNSVASATDTITLTLDLDSDDGRVAGHHLCCMPRRRLPCPG
jgi:quercetin dioxygenase-like cupin family protein